MYENVKYLGIALKDWRDKVFKGTFNLGELYQMVAHGIDLSKVSPAEYERFTREAGLAS